MCTQVWAALLTLVAVVGLASGAQPGRFEDPVPVRTVDAAISPMVYQGGTVVVRVKVNTDGSVLKVDVTKPVAALTDPVVTAVKQWRFSPGRLDGRAVVATTTVAVQIVLIRTVVPRAVHE